MRTMLLAVLLLGAAGRAEEVAVSPAAAATESEVQGQSGGAGPVYGASSGSPSSSSSGSAGQVWPSRRSFSRLGPSPQTRLLDVAGGFQPSLDKAPANNVMSLQTGRTQQDFGPRPGAQLFARQPSGPNFFRPPQGNAFYGARMGGMPSMANMGGRMMGAPMSNQGGMMRGRGMRAQGYGGQGLMGGQGGMAGSSQGGGGAPAGSFFQQALALMSSPQSQSMSGSASFPSLMGSAQYGQGGMGQGMGQGLGQGMMGMNMGSGGPYEMGRSPAAFQAMSGLFGGPASSGQQMDWASLVQQAMGALGGGAGSPQGDHMAGVKPATQVGAMGDGSYMPSSLLGGMSGLGNMGNPDAQLEKALDGQPNSFGIDWSRVLFGSDPRLMQFVTRDGLAPEVDNNRSANASLPGLSNTDKALSLADANSTEAADADGEAKGEGGAERPGDVSAEEYASNVLASLGDLLQLDDEQLGQLSSLGQQAMGLLSQRSLAKSPLFAAYSQSSLGPAGLYTAERSLAMGLPAQRTSMGMPQFGGMLNPMGLSSQMMQGGGMFGGAQRGLYGAMGNGMRGWGQMGQMPQMANPFSSQMGQTNFGGSEGGGSLAGLLQAGARLAKGLGGSVGGGQDGEGGVLPPQQQGVNRPKPPPPPPSDDIP